MGKHLSFWIGFFAAALLVVPVALGIMGVAEERLRQMAVVLFAGVSVLVVLLVVALFFRDAILRRVLGRSEVALEDVAGSLVGALAAASEGDRDKAADHARALVQGGVGWYTWSSFYRWVIGSALGLLLAFGAFVGTVLLFEQTRTLRVQTERIGEQTALMEAQTALMEAQTERLREQTEAAAIQNEIMSLSLVNQLREQMLASVETRPLGEWLATRGIAGVDQPLVRYATTGLSCDMYFDGDFVLNSPPSEAAVGAIAGLAQSPALGARVISALNLLAQDSHGSVVIGAVRALEQAGHPYGGEFTLRDLIIKDVTRLAARPYRLNVRRSFISNLICPDCDMHLSASIFHYGAPLRTVGGFNLVTNPHNDDPVNGFLITVREELSATWLPRPPVPVQTGPYFPSSFNGWMTRHKELPACEIMAEIARINPLLTMALPQ
ncbi:MAG: hypothetical protein AAF727_03490 [Pseudomonadota bacterium]